MKAKTEPDPTPKPFPKPAPTPMSGWLQIVSVAALCAYAVAVCWMVSRMKLPPEKPTANLLREGVQHAQEALRLHPNDPDYLCNVGLALELDGKSGEGVPYFQRSMAINPKNWKAYNLLGLALMDARNFSGAITNFEQALRLSPANKNVLDSLDKAMRLRDLASAAH